jgi:hypothetical protein
MQHRSTVRAGDARSNESTASLTKAPQFTLQRRSTVGAGDARDEAGTAGTKLFLTSRFPFFDLDGQSR